MIPTLSSISGNIPSGLQHEFVETLAEAHHVRIERIISAGQVTPPGEWYEQEWDEWVLLVSGEAVLLFADSTAPLKMKAGDHLMIPAGCRHRVEYTSNKEKTVWLTVHINQTVS